MARYEKILGYYRYPDTSDERWNTKQKKNEKKNEKKTEKREGRPREYQVQSRGHLDAAVAVALRA